MAGKHLVVDACIGASAGNKEQFPESKYSREALMAIKNNRDHKMVFSADLSKEWSNNAGHFGTKIRAEMTRKGRIVFVPEDAWRTLLGRCMQHLATTREKESFEKDFHLVAASLHTHRTLLTNETNLPNHLIDLRNQVPEVVNIEIGNPRVEEQACIDWITSGAPSEAGRKIAQLNKL